MGMVPTGTGSVCFRAAEGRAFSDIEKDVRELLSMGSDAAPVDPGLGRSGPVIRPSEAAQSKSVSAGEAACATVTGPGLAMADALATAVAVGAMMRWRWSAGSRDTPPT